MEIQWTWKKELMGENIDEYKKISKVKILQIDQKVEHAENKRKTKGLIKRVNHMCNCNPRSRR